MDADSDPSLKFTLESNTDMKGLVHLIYRFLQVSISYTSPVLLVIHSHTAKFQCGNFIPDFASAVQAPSFIPSFDQSETVAP